METWYRSDLLGIEIPGCPKCLNKKISKNGIVKGRQRFLCKCGHNFTTFRTARTGTIDDETKDLFFLYYLTGSSARYIADQNLKSHTAINNMIKKQALMYFGKSITRKKLIESGITKKVDHMTIDMNHDTQVKIKNAIKRIVRDFNYNCSVPGLKSG